MIIVWAVWLCFILWLIYDVLYEWVVILFLPFLFRLTQSTKTNSNQLWEYGNETSLESCPLRDKYHVLRSRCYIWKTCSFRRPSQAYEDIIFPSDHPSCFNLSFLLSDTVSSASLHRLTESWDGVQSMLQITRRKTMERPITMTDPLRIWSWEPNKMCFHPALENHVF